MLSDRWIRVQMCLFLSSGQNVVVGDSMGQMLSWKLGDLKVCPRDYYLFDYYYVSELLVLVPQD